MISIQTNKQCLNEQYMHDQFDNITNSLKHNQLQLSLDSLQKLLEIVLLHQNSFPKPIMLLNYKFCLLNNIAYCYQELLDYKQANFYLQLAHAELEKIIEITEYSLELQFIQKNIVIIQLLKFLIKFKIQYCFSIIKGHDQNYRKSVELLFHIFEKLVKIVKVRINQSIGHQNHNHWTHLQKLVTQGNTKLTNNQQNQLRRSIKLLQTQNVNQTLKKIIDCNTINPKENINKYIYFLGKSQKIPKPKKLQSKDKHIQQLLSNFHIEQMIKLHSIDPHRISKLLSPQILIHPTQQIIDFAILLSVTQFTLSVVLRLTQIITQDHQKIKPSELHLIYAIQILSKTIPDQHIRQCSYFTQLIKTYKSRYSNTDNSYDINSIAEQIQQQDEEQSFQQFSFTPKNAQLNDHLKTKKDKKNNNKLIMKKGVKQKKQFLRKESILNKKNGKQEGTIHKSMQKKLKHALINQKVNQKVNQPTKKRQSSASKARSLQIVNKIDEKSYDRIFEINNEEQYFGTILNKFGQKFQKDKNGRYYSVGYNTNRKQELVQKKNKKSQHPNKVYFKTINLLLKNSSNKNINAINK